MHRLQRLKELIRFCMAKIQSEDRCQSSSRRVQAACTVRSQAFGFGSDARSDPRTLAAALLKRDRESHFEICLSPSLPVSARCAIPGNQTNCKRKMDRYVFTSYVWPPSDRSLSFLDPGLVSFVSNRKNRRHLDFYDAIVTGRLAQSTGPMRTEPSS